MATVIDRRLADRRRVVSEEGARRRLRRVVLVLALVGIGAVAGWTAYYSPYLSLREVTVGGQAESRAAQILAENGIAVGVPTIKVRRDRIESALLADPWIEAAIVRVTWPGAVSVDVYERVPVAWVQAGAVWLLAAADGHVVERASEPGDDLPRVNVGSDPVAPGDTVDTTATAALRFVHALPATLTGDLVIRGDATELRGVVAGHDTILGYPSDMEAKAAALVALLDAGLAPTTSVNVVSPSNPATRPRLLVETSEEVIGEPQPKG